MDTRPEPPVNSPVLVVEDEKDIAEEIRDALEGGGYRVVLSNNVAEGLRLARAQAPALLIADRMLQGEDGLLLVETLRQEGWRAPVLVISAMSSVDDRIRGLKAGGDDYLVKPFDVRELTARVEALLRRAAGDRPTRLQVGLLEIDLVERVVRYDGRPIDILPREFKLLEYFMRRPGQLVTRAMLLEDVWKYKFPLETNVVDVHIGNLRRKLESGAGRRFIANIRSAGYRFDADA